LNSSLRNSKDIQNILESNAQVKAILTKKPPTKKYKPTFHLRFRMTERCNLNCINCHVINDTQYCDINNDHISSVFAKKVIDDYFTLHSHQFENIKISFYGGEPLICWKEIVKILEYIFSFYDQSKIRCIINTNATLLKKEIAKELSVFPIEMHIGCDGVESIHNKRRRSNSPKNAYSAMIQGIELLQKFNYKVQFDTCISIFNFTNLLPIVDLAGQLNITTIFLDFLFNNIFQINASEICKHFILFIDYSMKSGIKIGGNWLTLLDRLVQNNTPYEFSDTKFSFLEVLPNGSFKLSYTQTNIGHDYSISSVDTKELDLFRGEVAKSCTKCKLAHICKGMAKYIQIYHTTSDSFSHDYCNLLILLLGQLLEYYSEEKEIYDYS